ncbi:MAG: hypothetical protein CMI18_11195 [Opitutaceae bacterium]|nr:hypothetical protein [Opitutaceae bacterium]
MNVEISIEAKFTTGDQVEYLTGTPPKAIINLRRRPNINYGKFHLAIHEGEAIIFDANKTIGMTSPDSVEVMRLRNTSLRKSYIFFRAKILR